MTVLNIVEERLIAVNLTKVIKNNNDPVKEEKIVE